MGKWRLSSGRCLCELTSCWQSSKAALLSNKNMAAPIQWTNNCYKPAGPASPSKMQHLTNVDFSSFSLSRGFRSRLFCTATPSSGWNTASTTLGALAALLKSASLHPCALNLLAVTVWGSWCLHTPVCCRTGAGAVVRQQQAQQKLCDRIAIQQEHSGRRQDPNSPQALIRKPDQGFSKQGWLRWMCPPSSLSGRHAAGSASPRQGLGGIAENGGRTDRNRSSGCGVHLAQLKSSMKSTRTSRSFCKAAFQLVCPESSCLF